MWAPKEKTMRKLLIRLFMNPGIELGRQDNVNVRTIDGHGVIALYNLLETDPLPSLYSQDDPPPEPYLDPEVMVVLDYQASTYGAVVLYSRSNVWAVRLTGWTTLEHLVGPFFLGTRGEDQYLIDISARRPEEHELKK
jgi:hypothetical protein